MRDSITYYSLIFLLLQNLLSISIYADTDNPEELLQAMKKKYPDHNAIFLEHKRHVLIDWVDDSLRVTARQSYDMLYLNDQANIYAKEKVYTSHFAKLIDIDARTLVPQRKKYKEIEVTDFDRKSDISSGIFYDDSESLTFTFPAVQEGVRTTLAYENLFTQPTFLNAFHFGSYVPVEKSELIIKVHNKVTIDYKFFNLDSLEISNALDTEGDYQVFRFTGQQIAAIEGDSDAPSFSYYSPHIIYFIKQVNDNGENINLLGKPAGLYNLYREYIAEINHATQDEIMQPIVDSLLAGTTNEMKKVEIIYNWVQDNIKYIAFENGMRGLIPHNGSLVCQKRYGDCKDMASILHWMMKLAGVKSHFTWIGTRDLPYQYSELPTPNVDNHMITTYYHNEKPLFLDATGRYATINYPTSMIQGKEALVAIDDQNFKIEKVPVIAADKNQLYDSVGYTLQNSEIVGSGIALMTGYQKVFQNYVLEGLTAEKQSKVVNSLFQKGNNKFNIETFDILNLESKIKPLTFNYSFKLQDYVNEIDNEIYINLNLDRSLLNQTIDLEKRKLPIEHEYLYEDTFVSYFKLPDGVTTSFIPETAAFDHEKFGFSIHYETTESYIKQHKSIYVNTLLLNREDFKPWNEMINQLNDAYREAIILKTDSNKL